MNLAICWKIRLLPRDFTLNSVTNYGQGVKHPVLPSAWMVKMQPVRTISREVLRNPSTTARQTSYLGMMIQSELASDRKLSFQRPAPISSIGNFQFEIFNFQFRTTGRTRLPKV